MAIWAFRRLIARAGIVVLLFAQIAVAAYACPATVSAGEMLRAALTSGEHAAMPDCTSHDSGNPNLCLQHYQAGDQTVHTAPQLPVPPAVVTQAIAIESVLPLAGLGANALTVCLERVTSPPPLLRFGFLRI